MRKVVFDIETSNFFQEIGKRDPTLLDISLLAIYDSETDSYSSYLKDELNELWPILERTDLLIGYNSDHFDIPLLNKYYPGDLTLIRSLDLMKEVQDSLGRRIKLDSIAEATLGTKKSAKSGLVATEWWKAGEVEKVREYCIKDVEITKKIYDYALEHGKLYYRDLLSKDKHEVEIDTSTWEKNEGSGMTHSLPF